MENTYIAFYKGKQLEVLTKTTYEAQTKAKQLFKAKNNWDINIVLHKLGNEVIKQSTIL